MDRIDGEADYSNCSLQELRDVEAHIDPKANPKNYANLRVAIERAIAARDAERRSSRSGGESVVVAGESLNTVELNWLRTFKIWWYWLWRAMLLTFVVAILVGFLLGIFLFPFIGSGTTVKLISDIVGGAIGIFFGLLILKSIPEKRFSDFRVVLVARDPEDKGNDD